MTGQLCGGYADHVDHLHGRRLWPAGASSLTSRGSTSRWRRVRAFVLGRDGYRCQLPVDAAGNYDAAADVLPVELPAHPDDPANLRAACEQHNLQRNRKHPTTDRRQPAGRTRWDW